MAKKEDNNALSTNVQKNQVVEFKVGDSVLSVVDPQMKDLFIEPKPHDGTRIAAFLAKCVIPVKMGVFNIPERLIKKIENEAIESESILDVEACKLLAEIKLFQMETQSQAKSMMTGDPIDMFTYEAVGSADSIIDNYLGIVSDLCKSIGGVNKNHYSQRSFYTRKVLRNAKNSTNTGVIIYPMQDAILRLNKLSAGFEGYKILALMKSIDKISQLVGNDKINTMFGTSDILSILNKINFRVTPEMMMYHDVLIKLMNLVEQIGANNKISDDDIAQLFDLCSYVSDHMGNINHINN